MDSRDLLAATKLKKETCHSGMIRLRTSRQISQENVQETISRDVSLRQHFSSVSFFSVSSRTDEGKLSNFPWRWVNMTADIWVKKRRRIYITHHSPGIALKMNIPYEVKVSYEQSILFPSKRIAEVTRFQTPRSLPSHTAGSSGNRQGKIKDEFNGSWTHATMIMVGICSV